MAFICLSHPLIDESEPILFPGNPPNSIKREKCIPESTSNSSSAVIYSHNGTHIDAPFHCYTQGKTVQDLSVEDLIFDHVQIVNFSISYGELITIEHVQNLAVPPETEALILKTSLERDKRPEEYIRNSPGFDPSAAEWIREKTNIKLLGIDFLSFSSPKHREAGREAHRVFLKEDDGRHAIILLEDMKTEELSCERIVKKLMVVPFTGLFPDGCPVTVIAEV